MEGTFPAWETHGCVGRVWSDDIGGQSGRSELGHLNARGKIEGKPSQTRETRHWAPTNSILSIVDEWESPSTARHVGGLRLPSRAHRFSLPPSNVNTSPTHSHQKYISWAADLQLYYTIRQVPSHTKTRHALSRHPWSRYWARIWVAGTGFSTGLFV